MLDLNLNQVSKAAAAGDANAIHELLRAVVDDVHRLALRMLWHPIDAEDATEEILMDVVSRLPELAGDAHVGALRVAGHFLLRTYESPMERQDWTFEEMGEHLDRGLSGDVPADVPAEVRPAFAEEVKVGCTQTMLLCLDRPHRLAYVLDHIFTIDETTAASIVGVEPFLYRSLLQNAVRRLHTFMEARCGVINPTSSCRCTRRLGRDLRTGRVDPRRLLFVVPDPPSATVRAARPAGDAIEASCGTVRLFREQELRPAPPWIVERVSAFARTKDAPELLRA